MILRIFRATVHSGMQAEYERVVSKATIPFIKSQKDILAYFVGRPMGSSPDEYVFVTLWKDFESLKAFTGEKWEQPVLLDEEIRLLKEASVRHYQVVGELA
jgi:hypothetical protein